MGSHIGGIFPPRSVVDDFKAYANAMGIGTALHLCGRYARTVADPRGVGATDLWELCAGFERIQVNLHGDWFDPERVHLTGHGIEYFADQVAPERVILQHRGDWGSILVTTNLPFDEWTEVFGSERLTGALLDRLTHHVHILEMNGESYRLRHSRETAASQISDEPDDS